MGKRILALISIIVLAIAFLPNDATAGHDKGHVRVRIDDRGFNGTPGPFSLEVEQGQLVELTFEWAHQGYVGEEHIMVLEGYKLEWDKLDINKRNATVKFIADKTGTFTFKCDWKCDLHDYLQEGKLRVVAKGGSGTGAPVARTASKLALDSSEWTSRGQSVLFTASLKDDKGAPIPKASVRFLVDAEFIGKKGAMEIGAARTDANGIAFLDYRPTLDAPQQKITAQFEGMGVYGESAVTIEIQEATPRSSTYHLESMGLEDIRRAAPFVLVGIVLVVWATYAFVLAQVFGIFRLRERR